MGLLAAGMLVAMLNILVCALVSARNFQRPALSQITLLQALRDNGNYDVFLSLLQKHQLTGAIDGHSNGLITILAVSDSAMETTGKDIATAFSWTPPENALQANLIIEMFALHSKDPHSALANVLSSHICAQALNLTEVKSMRLLKTFAFPVILQGNISIVTGNWTGTQTNLPPAKLLPLGNSSQQFSNGVYYNIDRMLFSVTSKEPTFPGTEEQDTTGISGKPQEDKEQVPFPEEAKERTRSFSNDGEPIPSIRPSTIPMVTQNFHYVSATRKEFGTSVSPKISAFVTFSYSGPSFHPTPWPSVVYQSPYLPSPLPSPSPSLLISKPPQSVETTALTSALEGPRESNEPECFPSFSRVSLANGKEVTVASLSAGDSLKVSETETSVVIFFSHRDPNMVTAFYNITTMSGMSVILSGGHYLYSNGVLKIAKAVKAGDSLRTLHGPSLVSTVHLVFGRGLFAPHTVHGDIVVSGIVCSTYTNALHPAVAHGALSPVRFVAETWNASGLAWISRITGWKTLGYLFPGPSRV